MRKIKLITIALFSSVIFVGCVQSQYSKTVEVTKDASGKVVSTVETETVTQPGSGYPVKFEHLKDIQP